MSVLMNFSKHLSESEDADSKKKTKRRNSHSGNLHEVSGENFTPQRRRPDSRENYSDTPLQFHTDPMTVERC